MEEVREPWRLVQDESFGPLDARARAELRVAALDELREER